MLENEADFRGRHTTSYPLSRNQRIKIYVYAVLPVAFYRRETSSATGGEEWSRVCLTTKLRDQAKIDEMSGKCNTREGGNQTS